MRSTAALVCAATSTRLRPEPLGTAARRNMISATSSVVLPVKTLQTQTVNAANGVCVYAARRNRLSVNSSVALPVARHQADLDPKSCCHGGCAYAKTWQLASYCA